VKAIRVDYRPATIYRAAFYRATDEDGNAYKMSDGAAKQVNQDHPQTAAAIGLCAKMGWTGDLLRGEFPGYSVFIFADSPRIVNPTKARAAGVSQP
jgi:hypothetical protein